MNRKYAMLPILLIFIGISSLAAEAGVSFNIRYFDRRVYYLEQDPIFVQVTLTNNNPFPFRFKLADDRAFSLDFDVRTASNRGVDAAETLVRRRSQSQQVFFREVSIATGESFSFVEDLRDFVSLNQSGTYVVQAWLYPELFSTVESAAPGISPGRTLAATGQPIQSNRLSLSLRPRPVSGSDGIPMALDVVTNAILVRENLPPDEVVSYLLRARQQSQWEKFFLYLDLEAMLARDPYRKRQWNAESEEGRHRMLVRYKEELQSAKVDMDIALIPMNFVIERTVYSADIATVTVRQYFRVGNFTEIKRYTWHLERRDEYWAIVDYSVTNIGTQ
jgi:hypothetical protein